MEETTTMTRITKSFLRLCFVLALVLGLSSSTAFAQEIFIDASITGGGGSGTQADPYRAGDFQAALDSLNAGADSLVVLGGGTLTAPSGSVTKYDLTAAATFVTSDSTTTRGITLDLPFEFNDNAATGPDLTLAGVDIIVPGDAFILGNEEDVVTVDPAGWGRPGAVIFSGDAQLRSLKAPGTLTLIQRLVIEEGANVTFFSQVNQDAEPELQVTDSLVVDGTFNLGANDLEYNTGVFTTTPDPLLSVNGSITNGNSFRIDLSGLTQTRFATTGSGTVEALLDLRQSSADTTDISFSEASSVQVGSVVGANMGELLRFNGLESVTDSLVVLRADTVQTDVLANVGGMFKLDDQQTTTDIDFISNADLEIGGMASFTLAESATFNGTTFFDQAVTNTDVPVSFFDLATFDDDLTYLAATADITFAAPGVEGFAPLSEFDPPASVIRGDFTDDFGGTITLAGFLGDGDGIDEAGEGVHNLKFMEDVITLAGSGSATTFNTPGDSRVIFGGLSQQVEIGTDDLAIASVDILSDGVVEVEDNNQVGTFNVGTRVRLLSGTFDTDGRFDPRGADLTRRISADGTGNINGGGGSDWAYTNAGAASNGAEGVDLPDDVIYIGDQAGTTGPELPDLSDDALQVLSRLSDQNTAAITLDVPYTIVGANSGRFEALAGSTVLAADLTMNNETTVERGDGEITEDAGSLVYEMVDPFGVGSDGIDLEYSNTADLTTGVEFPNTDENADIIRDLMVNADEAAVALAEAGTYRVNRDAFVNSGTLDPNGQTLEFNTIEDQSNQFAVAFPGAFEGDGLFRVTGIGLSSVTGDPSGSAGTVFNFPATEVNKPLDDEDDENSDSFLSNDPGEESRVEFSIVNDTNTGADGFNFTGDFTIASAQDQDGAAGTQDGVQFLTGVDILGVEGSFVQNAGSFLSNSNGASITVAGSLTKAASDSSRFEVDPDVGSFSVGSSETDSLYQNAGNFSVEVDESFFVDGSVINEGAFFDIDDNGGALATAEITGSVFHRAGTFRVDDFDSTDDTVVIGGDFWQTGSSTVTEILNARSVTVDGEVNVAAGQFFANLGNQVPAENTFQAASLTVGDSTTAAASAAKSGHLAGLDAEFHSGGYSSQPFSAPKANSTEATDLIIITGATTINYDGQFLLDGYELQQGGDFTFLGFGDNPFDPANDNDESDNGLLGLVRFNGAEMQTVTTDNTPNTYFHGVTIDGAGVSLEGDMTINTALVSNPEGVPELNNSTFGGILFLNDGNIVTNDNAVVILAPFGTPQGGFDQRINADSGPVQGGSRNSHVVGTMTRSIEEQGATGGFVSSGYIFPLGIDGFYRALIMQPPTDLGSTANATVTIADRPDTPLDPFNVQSFNEQTNELTTLELNQSSEPFFNVVFDEDPNEDFNARVIAQGLEGINRIKQMRIIQLNENTDTWELAGIYDFTGDPNDDQAAGPNSFISGVPNIIHEGIDFVGPDANGDGTVIGLATDRDINPLTTGDALEIAGTVTYGGDPVEGATVTATDGDNEFTGTTDADGNYVIAGVDPGTYEVTASVSGSVSGVNSTDALLAVRGFAGLEDLSDFQNEIADVNDSGNVNATDALLIAQFGVGAVTSFEAGTFASTTATADASTQNVQGADLMIAAYGDVNMSGSVGSGSEAALAVADVSSAAKSAPSIDGVESGTSFEIPVRVNQDVTLGAYTLAFDFPTEDVSFEGVSAAEEGVITHSTNGTVRVAWFDNAGDRPISLNRGDELVTLKFKAADNVEKGATFGIKSVKGEFAGSEAQALTNVGLQVPQAAFGPKLPDAFSLKGNYPNPFTAQTQVAFDLPEDAQVSVQVYDILGRQVMSLPQQSMAAGTSQTLSVNGSQLGSGVYLYRVVVEMGSQTIEETGRMTVVK